MHFDIIGTGSRGNCVRLDCQNFTALIDIGVSFKKIRNIKPDLILLTHQHRDHFLPSTVKQMQEAHPAVRWCVPLRMVGKSAEEFDALNIRRVSLLPPWGMLRYRGATLISFPLHHDAPNSGWAIQDADGSSLMYATDTGDMDGVSLPDLDTYLIEANYDEEEIEERIQQKREEGGYVYEERVKRTHLSRQQADQWLADNAGPDSKFVYMHEHLDAHPGVGADER